MKVRVSSAVFCISFIFLLIGSKSLAADRKPRDEFEIMRMFLTSPIVFAIPGWGSSAALMASFLIVMLSEEEPSNADIMKQLQTVDGTVNRIEKLVAGLSERIPIRVAELKAIKNGEVQHNHIMRFIAEQFQKMHDNKNNRRLLEKDAKSFTDANEASLMNKVVEFRKLLLPNPKIGRTTLLEKYYEEISRKVRKGEWCGTGVSLNEYIYRKHEFYMMSMMKGYTVITESYKILAEVRNENYDDIIDDLQKEYRMFKRQCGEVVGALLAKSSLSIRRCDPPKHERGKNFLEFEKLIQGYLVPLRHFTPDRSEPLSCDAYANPIDYKHTEDRSNFYSQTCNGNVYNCMSTAGRALCPASTPSRRFDGLSADEWLWKRYFPNLGNLSACGDSDTNSRFIEKTYPIAVTDWEDYNPCGCLCDDWKDPASFRTIDLNPVFSHYENNMVITGLRLVNDSNVLKIEIQQGKLGPFGTINATSVRWLKHSEQRAGHKRPVGLHFHRRKINLNTVTIPADMAMIGVEFDYVDDELFYLKVHAAPVAYDRGVVQSQDKYPIYKPEKPKSELKLDAPTIPSLAPWNLRIDGEDKFITLQPSDWEKDAAQTLVPFLDLQEVVTNPPALLGGVNFAYRSTPGYGGFLSLELQSWNYTNRVLEYSDGRGQFP